MKRITGKKRKKLRYYVLVQWAEKRELT